MGWQPDFGRMFMAGLVVLAGIWVVPLFYYLGAAMIGGGLIYAISAGTGVFIGNVPDILRTGKEGARMFKKDSSGPSKSEFIERYK